jgi:hypothetical protein
VRTGASVIQQDDYARRWSLADLKRRATLPPRGSANLVSRLGLVSLERPCPTTRSRRRAEGAAPRDSLPTSSRSRLAPWVSRRGGESLCSLARRRTDPLRPPLRRDGAWSGRPNLTREPDRVSRGPRNQDAVLGEEILRCHVQTEEVPRGVAEPAFGWRLRASDRSRTLLPISASTPRRCGSGCGRRRRGFTLIRRPSPIS